MLLEESSDEEGEQSVISKRRTSDDLVKYMHISIIINDKFIVYLHVITEKPIMKSKELGGRR